MQGGQKTALITGASRGIGAAIAAEFHRCGIRVIAPTREELDLADPHSINRFVGDRADAVQVDILVNNAGINFINEFESIPEADWNTTLQVNLSAPFRLIQGVAPYMKAQRWGRIVNLSSMFGVITREKRAVYSATKSALLGLTRTLAVELAPFNVLVNALGPGYVETELTRQNNPPEELARLAEVVPMRRLAQPAEMAKYVAFLCSEDNSYMTGQLLLADGGFTCI
jgi:3-oxoacyl-[acyl-carrier protein] reductase